VKELEKSTAKDLATWVRPILSNPASHVLIGELAYRKDCVLEIKPSPFKTPPPPISFQKRVNASACHRSGFGGRVSAKTSGRGLFDPHP
jgi:hypothetical protein